MEQTFIFENQIDDVVLLNNVNMDADAIIEGTLHRLRDQAGEKLMRLMRDGRNIGSRIEETYSRDEARLCVSCKVRLITTDIPFIPAEPASPHRAFDAMIDGLDVRAIANAAMNDAGIAFNPRAGLIEPFIPDAIAPPVLTVTHPNETWDVPPNAAVEVTAPPRTVWDAHYEDPVDNNPDDIDPSFPEETDQYGYFRR